MQIQNNTINFNTLANLDTNFSSTNLPPPASKQEPSQSLENSSANTQELDSTSKIMNEGLRTYIRIFDELLKDTPILEESLENKLQKGEKLNLEIRFFEAQYKDIPILKDSLEYKMIKGEDIGHREIMREMEEEIEEKYGKLVTDMSGWIADERAYVEALRTSKSLDEFKEKYAQILEKRVEHSKYVEAQAQKSLEEDLAILKAYDLGNGAKAENASNAEGSEEKDKKSFTPIEAKSSRETYKDENSNKLEFAKIEQMRAMLDILFNQKAGENSALKGLFTTQTRKVDIKA